MAEAHLIPCSICGKHFKGRKGKSNKYCSIACYRIAQRSGQYARGPMPTTARHSCKQCGAVVIGSKSKKRNGERSDHAFCNRTCYDKYRREVVDSRIETCDHCGSEFNIAAGSRRRKFCSESCWKSHRKATPKNCPNCNCLFTPVKAVASGKFISHNSGKTCSAYCHNQWIRNDPERKRKIGDAFRGANHPNWQGGKSLLNNVSNRGPNWKKQRAAALRRDKYQCVDCGITNDECVAKYGRGLDVDHVTPFHNFNSYKKANALSNLECRCTSCHRIEEAKRSMVQMVLPLQDSYKRQHHGRRSAKQNLAELRAKNAAAFAKAGL